MSDQKAVQQVTVGLENGLHMVPCSRIAEAANRFEASVQIVKGDVSVNAKTILDLLTLNAEKGATLVLEAAGNDAESAVAALVRLFESNFEVGEQSHQS